MPPTTDRQTRPDLPTYRILAAARLKRLVAASRSNYLKCPGACPWVPRETAWDELICVFAGRIVEVTDVSLTGEPGMSSTRLEGELRESDALYRLLAEHSTDMISKHTPEGVYTYASPACRPLLGYDPEELIGRDAYELFHPDDLEDIKRVHSAILERPATCTVDYRIRRKDGSYTWFETSSRTVRDQETDAVLEIIAVSRDITKRGEAKGRELVQARLLEQVQAAVIATDLRGKVTHWNEHAEKLYGWSREEVLGRDIMELTVGSGEAAAAEEIMETLKAGETWEGEFVVRRKDGSTFPAHVTDSIIRDAEGRPVGMVGVSTDITKRKQTEQELKESEDRFRAIFEQAPVGISHNALDGSWIRVNKRFCDILGYSREELLEKTYQEITHPGDLDADLEQTRQLLAGEIDSFSREKRYLKEDGSVVWGNLTVSLVREPSGEPDYLIAVIEDITERKCLEESLREIREAERRRIARDLHDIVLQDLAGALQGMQAAQVESKGADLDHETTALRRAVGGLRNVIYDLRLEKDQPFVRAVESLVELNRQLTPERAITLRVADVFPPEIPDAAEVELLRILQEALVNARRHSDARHVEVILSANRRGVRAEVLDDGLGFDPAAVREGVGLAGIRERVSTLGGKLEIESVCGGGASLKVEVPLPG
jgi:PAS domain S-box-containing protein